MLGRARSRHVRSWGRGDEPPERDTIVLRLPGVHRFRGKRGYVGQPDERLIQGVDWRHAARR
jgi:hypothetical protein